MTSPIPPLTPSAGIAPQSKSRANAEVLQWQARLRVIVAVIAGGIGVLLQASGFLHGNLAWLIGAVAGYIAAVSALKFQIRQRGAAGGVIVGVTVLVDLLFIFVTVLASSPAYYYDRILILSFFVLHLTESYFGRQYATMALVVVIGGYLGVAAAAIGPGSLARWPEALWSVALFAIAATVFILQYGSFQQRLSRIVVLFERAEEGDLSRSYDVEADRNPDAITRVGRAYNRVRQQLASMVLTDPLTGCLNRRGLDQAMGREIARVSRAQSDLSLLAIDLDHFKQVNDTFGHLAGDAVLRDFGVLLGQAARAGDAVARTGGEEFSILLPDTAPDGAYTAAIRLCETVRAHAFMANGRPVRVTISIGVVSMDGTSDRGGGGSNLKEFADEALYAAKRAGRDCVSVWKSPLSA